jgi:N-acetylglucosamine malate deacetylase 2
VADSLQTTRKDFLRTMAGTALLPFVSPALPASSSQPPNGKLLIVVAHPDDEYACAAVTYRLVWESGWIADQVIVTDGESGYRYAALAEAFYGVPLSADGGHARLASIRKQETARAGKVLGIRNHHFLDQKDLGFATDASVATTANWDQQHVRAFLTDLLLREEYDVVVTLLPTKETHGHHKAATILALEAVANLPEEHRPLVLGAEPQSVGDTAIAFNGLPGHPLTQTAHSEPIIQFDRSMSFGYQNALNYQIVVNWMIAEHKSQGLFQNDTGKHDAEHFWLFAASGNAPRIQSLRDLLHSPSARAVAG